MIDYSMDNNYISNKSRIAQINAMERLIEDLKSKAKNVFMKMDKINNLRRGLVSDTFKKDVNTLQEQTASVILEQSNLSSLKEKQEPNLGLNTNSIQNLSSGESLQKPIIDSSEKADISLSSNTSLSKQIV